MNVIDLDFLDFLGYWVVNVDGHRGLVINSCSQPSIHGNDLQSMNSNKLPFLSLFSTSSPSVGAIILLCSF